MTFTQDGRKPWTQHADRLACEIRIWDDGSEDFGQRNSVAKHSTFRPPFLQRSGKTTTWKVFKRSKGSNFQSIPSNWPAKYWEGQDPLEAFNAEPKLTLSG